MTLSFQSEGMLPKLRREFVETKKSLTQTAQQLKTVARYYGASMLGNGLGGVAELACPGCGYWAVAIPSSVAGALAQNRTFAFRDPVSFIAVAAEGLKRCMDVRFFMALGLGGGIAGLVATAGCFEDAPTPLIGANVTFDSSSAISGTDVFVGPDVTMGASCEISGFDVFVGSGVTMGESCGISGRNITVGPNVYMGSDVHIYAQDTIIRDTIIGSTVEISSADQLIIQNNTVIGDNSKVATRGESVLSNATLGDGVEIRRLSPSFHSSVVVKDSVLGASTTVLPGSTLENVRTGENVLVGEGAHLSDGVVDSGAVVKAGVNANGFKITALTP